MVKTTDGAYAWRDTVKLDPGSAMATITISPCHNILKSACHDVAMPTSNSESVRYNLQFSTQDSTNCTCAQVDPSLACCYLSMRGACVEYRLHLIMEAWTPAEVI